MLVLRRGLIWGLSFLRYAALVFWDALRRKNDVMSHARRMRQALERVPNTGPRIGRQLSMRLDLMPFEFALELAEIQDRRPPMKLEVALDLVQRTLGQPLDQVFKIFDPTPIFASTTDTIYQAQLLSGEGVAVKVRRPGIRALVMADLVALCWLTRALETLTLVRPGAFDHLRGELLDFANEELDYGLQVRYQRLFRRRARRDRLRWVDAPKVWGEHSNFRVMVSGFASGVRCSEVLDVIERGDDEGRARLAAMGIDPQKVARRLLQVSWWSTFESLFFLAEPSPENIVVQPGNRLVFLSFADCSTLSGRNRRFYRQMLTQLSKDDVSGAAQSITQMLSPLPFIDTYEFTKSIEAGLWQELFAMRDPKARWWERSTAGVWRVTLREARKQGVNVRLDVLRLMRSALSLDAIAARLDPRLRLLKEFRRYQNQADRRAARRFIRDATTSDPAQAQARMLARAARTLDGLQRLGLWVESTVENLPIANLAMSGKAATMAAELVRLLFRAGAVGLLAFAILAFQRVQSGAPPSLGALVRETLGHPGFLIAVGLLLMMSTRRVLFRLDDMGKD